MNGTHANSVDGIATRETRVLLVDDDRELCQMLTEYLSAERFEVSSVHDGGEALRALRGGDFDVLILDVMLPTVGGFDVLRELGAAYAIPILMLTARGDDVDRIVGLELGADDYLGKPFNPRELVARVQAILRRIRKRAPAGAPDPEGGTVAFGECVLDMATRRLTRQGTDVSLTSGEFSLLAVFARHPNRPLSRERLVELARGREAEAFERSMDVQVSRLRRLIEADPTAPRLIQTVWGFGYVFVPEGTPR